MKLYKWIIEIGCGILLVAVGAWVAWSRGWIGHSGEELKIDRTATVVTGIRQIAELSTVSYCDEFTVSRQEKRFLQNARLVIIARGKVRAGIDLKKVSDKDVRIAGDSLLIKLPEAEILDATINPSDFEIFIADGKWSHEQVQALEDSAMVRLRERAISAGILKKAEQNAKEEIGGMYRSLGFKEVLYLR